MSATSPDPQDILLTVERCWERGDSLGDTVKSVKRLHGIDISPADVQPTFARLDRERNKRSRS